MSRHAWQASEIEHMAVVRGPGVELRRQVRAQEEGETHWSIAAEEGNGPVWADEYCIDMFRRLNADYARFCAATEPFPT